jgi:LytS/YehU family sensor histidine kinase
MSASAAIPSAEYQATPLDALRRIYGWPRLKVALGVAVVWIIPFHFTWETDYWVLHARFLLMVFFTLTAFGVFEVWPRRLPRWLARWALQVIAVALAIPAAVLMGYTLTTLGIDPPWWKDSKRMTGAATFIFLGMITAPWVAVAALLTQIKEEARKQALQFALTKSELEKTALDSRFRLLQAQVQPHFLFNTLANVRELVITGSPHAPQVLESLIAYLRAAVPRLDAPMATLAQEVELVRAYLDIMQMRLPDRLQYAVDVEPAAHHVACPPMTLLTLVENAMRHGIDPAEEGGRIDVRVRLDGGRLVAEVADTGIGLRTSPVDGVAGLGTGIANLRERLALACGADATVTLTPSLPRGTRAVVTFAVKV